jgi:hypothetical protein
LLFLNYFIFLYTLYYISTFGKHVKMASPVQIIMQPSYTALVAAIASLLSLYLLYKMSQKSGFYAAAPGGYACANDVSAIGSSTSNCYGSIRDDTGSMDSARVTNGFRVNRGGFKSRVLGFNANAEPPVFWNAGDYQAVGNAQHSGIAAEGTGDDGSAWGADSASKDAFTNKLVPAPY